MRLRKTLRSSSDFPRHHESSRHSLNGFCFAHDHAGRESAIPECAMELATLSRSGHVGEKDRSENAAAEWSRGYGHGSIRSFEATWPLRRLDFSPALVRIRDAGDGASELTS
jgi:hypothetical protein